MVAKVGEREGELFKRNMKDINFFIIVYEMNFTNLRKYPRVCVFFCEYLSNAYIQYHHTHTHMEPASERASATEYLLTIVLLKFCYLHISIVCEFYRCCCWCTKGKEEGEKTFGRKSAINSRLEYISTRIGFWNAFVSVCELPRNTHWNWCSETIVEFFPRIMCV